MVSLNKVLLIGNLTKDPELRYTPKGTAVANIRIAVNHKFKDRSGEYKEDTCFVNVTVWDKQAENCNQYLQKGRQVLVEGSLQSRSWDTADGKKHSVIEVRAERVQFLGSGGKGVAGEAPDGQSRESEGRPGENTPVVEDIVWDE